MNLFRKSSCSKTAFHPALHFICNILLLIADRPAFETLLHINHFPPSLQPSLSPVDLSVWLANHAARSRGYPWNASRDKFSLDRRPCWHPLHSENHAFIIIAKLLRAKLVLVTMKWRIVNSMLNNRVLKVNWKQDVRYASCGLKPGLKQLLGKPRVDRILWRVYLFQHCFPYERGSTRKFGLGILADTWQRPSSLSRGQSCTASHPERPPGSVVHPT